MNTNWLFYAVVSLDFKHHFKKTLVFMLSLYGIVLLQYIITLMYIDIPSLLIYLFSVVSIMLFSIGIAYSKGSMIKKIIVYGLYLRIAVYVLLYNPYIMLAGVLPLVIALFMAKNDFAEWGYL
jgi:hypothetical protein